MCFFYGFPKLSANVPALGEVANFGTDYFLLKIKILAKRERELTTKFAIARNGCCVQDFYFVNFSSINLAFLCPFSVAELNQYFDFSIFFSVPSPSK